MKLLSLPRNKFIEFKKLILILLFPLFITSKVISQEKTSTLLSNEILIIQANGVAFLGSGITEDNAKILAIRDAQRRALEQAGIYLESHTEVLNYRLEKDEIITFTGGLLKSNILEEKRVIINNMFAFQIKIQATIDTKLLNQRIVEIRSDYKFRQQLEAERERIKQLEAQIAELKTNNGYRIKEKVKQTIVLFKASDWVQLGIEAKDSDQKIKFFSEAIKIDPNYPSAYANRASVYNDLGQYQNAIKDFDKAISLDSKFVGAYCNRAITYFNLGNTHEAIEDCNKAISIEPNLAPVYNNRGTFYKTLGDYDNALKDYNQSIKLDSVNAKFYRVRAVHFRDIRYYDKSMEDFQKAIALNPQDADAYCDRGKLYFLLERNNSALQDYNKTLSIDPKHGYAYFFRALLYGKLDQYEQAATDFNRYLELNGNKDGQADSVRKWIRDLGFIPNY